MRRPARKKRLSELTLKRLRPAKEPFLVWDTKQSGLALRVRPTGARSWYCVYSRHGRPRWYRIGDASAIGLADARMLAAEAMVAVAKGGDPAADKKAARSKGTFAELAATYVEQYAKKHNRSWQQADALVRRHLVPKWGKLQASDITRSDVKAMMRSITAPIVANQVLAAASAIFSWAIREEEGGVKVNPCIGVTRNPTKSRERVLSDGEIPKFWAAFDTVGLMAGAALKAILLLGQRPGEVAAWRHEHIKDGWWEMPGEEVPELGWVGAKNSENHRVWLPVPVQKLLADLNDDGATTGFVFANARGGAVDKLDLAMREVCQALGAERATPHDLRRTHGTTIAALGFGRDIMNRVQNHKEGGIASVYDRHQYASEIKHVMEAVAAHIIGLIEGSAEGGNVVTFAR